MSRIVIALGGNALGNTPYEQLELVTETAKPIVDLIEAGNEVIIAHGNGPQVGMIQNAFAAYCRQKPSADVMPLSMCVAMSQVKDPVSCLRALDGANDSRKRF